MSGAVDMLFDRADNLRFGLSGRAILVRNEHPQRLSEKLLGNISRGTDQAMNPSTIRARNIISTVTVGAPKCREPSGQGHRAGERFGVAARGLGPALQQAGQDQARLESAHRG